MTFSVVIPSYNQEQYLSDAIDSAITQTVKPLEVIVVDDGSPDNSYSICMKYMRDTKLVKAIRQVNKGLPSARNTGIMNAAGDYIIFLDADDIMAENYIEVVEGILKETQADIVAPSFKCFGVHNIPIILMPEPKLLDFREGNRIGYSAAFRRSALVEVGGYSPRMTYGYEDMHLTINLLARGKKLVTTPEILWLYRTKEKSMIHESQAHHVELMAQISKDFPDVIPPETVVESPLPR